jgi:uncharacterized protein (TIGR00304 family)
MNSRYAGIFLILSGFLILIALAFDGLVKAGFFLFIPFIMSSSPLAIIPFIMIFLGIILIFISVPEELSKKYGGRDWPYSVNPGESHKQLHVGGFLMVGPIPIIFGNNNKLIYISMAVAIIVIIIYLIFTFHLL